MTMESSSFRRRFLSVEGQICLILSSGPRNASEIYLGVYASQPTVSDKLARMSERGEIIQLSSRSDRRVRTYMLAPAFRNSIAGYLEIFKSLDNHRESDPALSRIAG